MDVRQTEVIFQLVKYDPPTPFKTKCCTNLMDLMTFQAE